MSSSRRSREVAQVGINPIEYRAWKGIRSAQKSRLYVIAKSVFRHKIRSFGVIALLGLGFLLLHAFQIIFTVMARHESLDAQTMYDYMGSGGAFAIFAILLAAVVTSDLIADDMVNSSFVLYFSRAIKVRDYLAGRDIRGPPDHEPPVRDPACDGSGRLDGDPDRW